MKKFYVVVSALISLPVLLAEDAYGGYGDPGIITSMTSGSTSSTTPLHGTSSNSDNDSGWVYDEDDVVYDKSVECRTETENGENKIVCPVVCTEMDDRDKTYSSCLYACDNLNDGYACQMVADLYYYAIGAKNDYNMQVHYYKKACELNYGDGCMNISRYQWSGSPDEIFYLEKACKLNVPLACNILAVYVGTPYASEQDRKKFKFYNEKLCGENGFFVIDPNETEIRICEQMKETIKMWENEVSDKGKGKVKK